PIGLPQMTPRWVVFFPTLALIVLLGGALLIPLLGAGRSPHVMFRPHDIDMSLDDVKGMPVVVEEVVKTLNLFLAHTTFRDREGGAIGFIEEIDAIGASRSSAGPSGVREGVAGVVNELLIQLQSFDVPPASVRVRGWVIDRVNRLLPVDRQRRGPKVPPANIL